MKKLLLVLILLLGIGGAGAGYYLFWMKPHERAKVAEHASEAVEKKPAVTPVAPPEKKVNTKFFVNEHKLAVRNKPDINDYPIRYMYKGDKITVLEQKNGWGRISGYFVYQEGGPEIGEWVAMDGLSENKPIISKEERDEIITSYINKSDDLKLYKDKFLKATGQLLDEKICVPEDFEELKGWVRSIKYKNKRVYFIYCGGLKTINKIYFDVDTGKITYR